MDGMQSAIQELMEKEKDNSKKSYETAREAGTTGNILVLNEGLNPAPSFNFMLRVEGIYDLPCRAIHVFQNENEYELKNIAVNPEFQGQGYGKQLIDFLFEHYHGKVMYVGTGESLLTIPFYKKCGFIESHRIKNFFIDNYDHSIFECGKQLVDMVYLKREWKYYEKEIF